MSRPKHLLCLSIKKDKINPKNLQELEVNGWTICDLTEPQPISNIFNSDNLDFLPNTITQKTFNQSDYHKP